MALKSICRESARRFRKAPEVWLSVIMTAIFGGVAIAVSHGLLPHPLGPTKLPTDPMQFRAIEATVPPGLIVYAAYVKTDGYDMAQRYLAVRRIGQPPMSGSADKIHHFIYEKEVSGLVFEPQFSPDGQTILFKLGWPYDNGSYDVCLWNRKTQQLQLRLIKGLTYGKLLWSPDGRYLAFDWGGNAEGDEGGGHMTAPPIELNIYDFKAKRSRVIAQSPTAKSFAWTRQGTLLYSRMDEKAWLQDFEERQNAAISKPAVRPDIYEVPAGGGVGKLVLRDGYDPAPSPDGTWIACFSSSFPATKTTKAIVPNSGYHMDLPVQSYLCLYNRVNHTRKMIQAIGPYYPDLIWTPDSKGLIVVAQDDNPAGHISALQIPEFKEKSVATLKATDTPPLYHSGPTRFQPFQVSKDGSLLFLVVSEYTGQGESLLDEMKSLKTVNLKTGQVSLLAKVYDEEGSSLGFDWFDAAVAPQHSAKPKK